MVSEAIRQTLPKQYRLLGRILGSWYHHGQARLEWRISVVRKIRQRPRRRRDKRGGGGGGGVIVVGDSNASESRNPGGGLDH